MPALDHLYVLAVDDNEDARDILKLGLEHAGAVVYVAPSAPEGLFLLSKVLPDVIITDMTMPPMDGYEFLSRLKGSPVWRHIPVIAVTGYDEVHAERRVRAAGFAGYFRKPFDMTALVAAILRVVNPPKPK